MIARHFGNDRCRCSDKRAAETLSFRSSNFSPSLNQDPDFRFNIDPDQNAPESLAGSMGATKRAGKPAGGQTSASPRRKLREQKETLNRISSRWDFSATTNTRR
jgi:hypothetical protein